MPCKLMNRVNDIIIVVQLLSHHTYCSVLGFPVLYLLEFPQTHVHRDGDVIQPSHPLLSPFPTAFNLSQHQGLSQTGQS